MNSKVKRFYNEVFYPHPSHYLIDPNRIYKTASATIGVGHINKKILVVGCGSVLSVAVANTCPKSDIYGIDISENQIAIAKSIKRKFGIKNCHNFVGDICYVSDGIYPYKFDIIDASGVLHHIKEVDKALKNISNLLHQGGLFTGMVYSNKRPKEIRERCEYFIHNKFTVIDVKAWMESTESNYNVLKWFDSYQQTEQEISDTWLNPFFREYDKESFSDLLIRFGFDNPLLEYDNKGMNLIFSTTKIDRI